MLVLTTLALIGSAAAAAVAKLPSYHLNHTHLNLQPFRWHAPPEMGNFTLTGTHDEVAAQIAALKPLWQTNATHFAHLFNHTLAAAHKAPEHLAPLDKHLAKRSNRVNQFCHQPQWLPAEYWTIMHEYQSILNRFGNGLCEALPHSCSRFACSYDNSINMCNDQNVPAIIPCATLAQNAKFIDNFCSDPDHVRLPTVEGQAFYINPSYNVLVKHTDAGRSC